MGIRRKLTKSIQQLWWKWKHFMCFYWIIKWPSRNNWGVVNATNQICLVDADKDCCNYMWVTLRLSHWFQYQLHWKRDLFPFEFIYSDGTIRSGLVSHSQNYSTLWLYIYIYCWYYGIKWIFTVLDMYEIIPILYKSRPM